MKKMNMIVNVREVHTQQYLVENVTSEAEAKERVANDDNVTLLEKGFEYSHTLDRDTWTTEPQLVELVKPKKKTLVPWRGKRK